MKRIVFYSLVAAAVMGLAGCASNNSSPDQRSAGRHLDDKALLQNVKSALNDSVIYKFPEVKVNTYEGTVQLAGFVDTTEQKQEAEQITRSVRGVYNVQNKITLKNETERVRGIADRDTNSANAGAPPR